jgi:hypothetical protein
MSKKARAERAEQIRSMAGLGPALAARSMVARPRPRPGLFTRDRLALAITVVVVAIVVLAKALH